MSPTKQINIIFDLDDTLINTSSTILKRILILLDKYNICEGGLYIHNLLCEPDREEILGRRYNFAKDFWQEYETLRKIIRPRPIGDIRAKLESFVEEGFDMGIVTNSPNRKVNEFLDNIKVPKNFFYLGIYDNDNNPYIKPDPRCFETLRNSTHGNIIYIGDSIKDFEVSKNAGIDFIGVCTGLTDRYAFLEAGLVNSNIFQSILEVNLKK